MNIVLADLSQVENEASLHRLGTLVKTTYSNRLEPAASCQTNATEFLKQTRLALAQTRRLENQIPENHLLRLIDRR
jgi:hypothetical protein